MRAAGVIYRYLYICYVAHDSCVKEKPNEGEGNGIGWMIAVAIFIVIGLVGYYFYKKQKQLESPKSKDAIKATSEKFEKCFTEKETQRTIGSLAKS